MFKKIILAVLLAAPLTLCAQSAAKFAHFDYAAVAQAMPEYKTAMTELEALGQKYQTELEGMQTELQTKYEKYQKEVTDETPENIRTRRQQEIQEMGERLEQARQDNQQAFEQARVKKTQPIMQKIADAVNAIAKEGNYVYVFDQAAAANSNLFINETLSEDVTKKVMAKLGVSATASPAPAAK